MFRHTHYRVLRSQEHIQHTTHTSHVYIHLLLMHLRGSSMHHLISSLNSLPYIFLVFVTTWDHFPFCTLFTASRVCSALVSACSPCSTITWHPGLLFWVPATGFASSSGPNHNWPAVIFDFIETSTVVICASMSLCVWLYLTLGYKRGFLSNYEGKLPRNT